jgi:chorismate synthase
MRFLTAGESHGPVLTAIIEGLPAGLLLTEEYVNEHLRRRQGGYGRGGRMKIETDQVRFLAGVRGGFTTGAPVALAVENKDWENWREIMAPGPGARLDLRTLTRPRPGHADLAGALKYGHRDIRNVLERASARETAARVAVGAVARRLLEELEVEIAACVVQIGPVAADVSAGFSLEEGERPFLISPGDPGAAKQKERFLEKLRAWRQAIARSPVYCPDPAAGEKMVREIGRARENGDTLGGIFEVRVYGLPPGLGSYVHWDRRLDGRLAAALMAVPGVKGVEIGAGFALAALPGSAAHDEIYHASGSGFFRRTNRAGGLEGGVTNGEPLLLRAVMKPIPTLGRPLASVDLPTKEPAPASVERSDVCAVPAASVVGEAAVAWVLAEACLEKYGGDTLAEVTRARSAYLRALQD